MLFDLRGRGRRRTVQTIYLSLAILMGGGLVLFGIGSSSSGGLFDAFSGDGGGGNSGTASIDKRVDRALARTKANPKDPAAWSALSIARFQRANLDGVQNGAYTKAGKRRLGLAATAWERHLALDPKVPSARNAKLMAVAYSVRGLNEPSKAVIAQQVVLDAESSPTTEQFQQLAQLAYQAGDNRTGDLASNRAVELADKDQRTALRKALEAEKQKAASAAAQQAPTPPAQ